MQDRTSWTKQVPMKLFWLHFHGVIFGGLFSFLLGLQAFGQSPSLSPGSSGLVPEAGFLSPSKYTNAFFGFSLPRPQDASLHEKTLSLNRGARDHLLIGFHSPSKSLVSFTITATQLRGDSEKEARKSAAARTSWKAKETKIGGKTFWRSESPTKTGDGGMHLLILATAINGYTLQFEVTSFNPEITIEVERDVEQLTFFDPSKAKEVAGADSKPYLPGASQFSASRIGQVSAGSVSENEYRNQELGFRYEFPQGWVLMSKANDESMAAAGHKFYWGNSPTTQGEHEAASECTRNLLLVTRHLESSKTQFNSMALLVVADPKCAAGSRFPKTVDDHEAVQQVAKQIVEYFRIVPTATAGGPARVRAFNNAGRVMIEISQSFTMDAPASPQPDILSSISLIQDGDYWVLWMFAAGSKGELDELRRSKIFFDDPGAPAMDPKTP
jgi:hypothetical protein